MTRTEVLKQLESLGTAQNRKIYARHGVSDRCFGVSYANFTKLRKKIGVDHALAEQLWATGIHDAKVLAAMIADPARLTAAKLDAWVEQASDAPTVGAFGALVARTSAAVARIKKWTASRNEWIASTGWYTLACVAMAENDLEDAFFERYLKRIASDIQQSPNRVRYNMNNTLIAIGVRNAALTKIALAIAKKIGKVEVDHGETGCKTPDAAAYIKKTLAHRRAKAAKRRA